MRVIALPIAVLLSVWHSATGDDFLQLVVWGKGNGSIAALAQLAQDKVTFATQFASNEGSSYKFVEAGDRINRNLADGGRRQLVDVGCPNSCANSGSVKCESLGCAYCGRCGGRRRQRQLRDGGGGGATEKRGRVRALEYVRTGTEQREIETEFEADLDQYCEGKDNCELKARVMRIYSNGTVVRAN